MSLSWANLLSGLVSILAPSNQLLVFLGADHVAVIYRSQSLRNRVIAQKQVKMETLEESSKLEAPNWQQATAQLEKLLSTMQLKPSTRLNITLASEFVRYMSLPALQIRMNATEKLAYVAAAYQDVYGEVVNDWEINCHDAPASEATLAAAIDKKLLTELSQIALKHGLTLNSVQPYLMRAFNALAKKIGHATGYFVIVEPKRLLLINLQDGKYQHLRVFAFSDNWQSEFKNLMLREALLSNLSQQEILVYAPAHQKMVIDVIDGWQLKRINALKNVNAHFECPMLEVTF